MSELTYEDVLEYLSDRAGDPLTFSSHPTMGGSGATLLGLTMPGLYLVDVGAVALHEDQWLNGNAGARIRLIGDDVDLNTWAHPEAYDGGLVITREWFGAGVLDDDNSTLRIIVRANLGARPFFPAVGAETPDDEDEIALPSNDVVGWGFTFDFDGDAPYSGRWALRGADE